MPDTARDSRFHRVFAAWVGGKGVGDADAVALLDQLRARATALGWDEMLARLAAGRAAESSLGGELIAIARAVIDGPSYDQAVGSVRALSLPDFDRAVACVYASCEPELVNEDVHLVALRLAAETASDGELAGRIYLTLGESAKSIPDWPMRAFEDGIRRTDTATMPGLQARLYLALAKCYDEAQRVDDAVVAARVANVLALRVADQATATLARTVHGTVLLKAGRFDEATAAMEPLLSVGKIDRPTWASALWVKGGRAQGIAEMRRALAELERAGDAATMDRVAAWLAQAAAELLQSGQVPLALDALADVARRTSGRPLDERTAQPRLLYASALQMAGDTAQAEIQLGALLTESRAQGVRSVEMTALYVLGENALAQRRFSDALTHYQAAAERAEELGQQVVLASSLNKIATTFTLLGEPARAIELHERALAIHRAQSALAAVVVDLIQGAQAALSAGDLDRAKAWADELAVLGPQHPPADAEWIPFVIARVAAASGDWPRARDLFREVLLGIEDRRRGFATLDQQWLWSEQKADTHGLAIEAAIAAGAAGDAIEFLELGRNRYLQALSGVDVEETPRSWNSLVEAVPADHVVVWFGGFPQGLGVVAAWRRAAGDVALACRFDRSLTGSGLSAVFNGDLREVLAAHAAGQLVDQIARMIHEKRELNVGADAYWQGHESLWAKSLTNTCDFLRQRVWPRIVEAAGDASPNLLLLPSVGCSEMPVSAAAPDTTSAGTSLVVCMAPSLTMIAKQGALAALDRNAGFKLTQIVNASEDDALVCSVVEARLAAQAFGAPVVSLRGRKATRERVFDALATSDVVHFIGHAFVHWQDPMQSGLVCAPRGEDQGVVTLREIIERIGRIHSRLIVLSACQIGYVQAGDRQNDFLNLPAALVAAGARTVIAPRWKVDDLPTAMLLSRMMDRWLRAAMPVPQALADARRWLRDDVTTEVVTGWIDAAVADPNVDRDVLLALGKFYQERNEPTDRPFAHVSHWGGFEVMGNPTP